MKKISVYICAMFLLFGIAADLQAVTLQALFDGEEIIIGDKRFYDWVLYDSTGVEPAGIEVTPLTDQPLNLGLRYDCTPQLRAVCGEPPHDEEYREIEFAFSVETLSGLSTIKDNSLEIVTGSADERGRVLVHEEVWDPGNTRLADKEVSIPGTSFDEAQFAPQRYIRVTTRAYAEAKCVLTWPGHGFLDTFDQRFSQVEPCEGDFDNDGDVDGSDVATFAEHFGRTNCP